MGSANEFARCVICGYEMYARPRYEDGPITWEPSLWRKTVIALRGPHEQYCIQRKVDPLSEKITEHAASPCDGQMGHFELYHSGQWLDDPLVIPDLASRLLSNLQLVEPHTIHPGNLQTTLESLPQELQDRIISLLRVGNIGLDCTRLLPQSHWKQLFLQISFLWDLDKSLVSEYKDKDGKEWDWERLFRQVMARVQPLTYPENSDVRAWSYDEVGLDVPPGFTNRRRIWQLLEDMDPDEVEKYGLEGREDDIMIEEDDKPWGTFSDIEPWQDWGQVLDPSGMPGSDLQW
ncbi:hypothetical protein CEP53_013527 [Fusarium sp. AF-6]|nr:hypothetical protein CEP53_013527 [Fusarium sp. AF-6]